MNKIKDFIFQITEDVNWEVDIIDDMHPILKEIGNIRRTVVATLDMREYEEYMKLSPSKREDFIKEKAYNNK